MGLAPKPIFLDPTGHRAFGLRVAAATIALAALALLFSFMASVAFAPPTPATAEVVAPVHGPPLARKPTRKFAAARKALFARIAADRRARAIQPPLVAADQISGAYYQPYGVDYALSSFKAHAADLTHVYPTWLSLGADGGSLITTSWKGPDIRDKTRELETTARANGVRIVPLLQNAEHGVFDLQRVKRMLDDPAKSVAMSNALLAFVTTNHYQGVQLDFENLDGATGVQLGHWLGSLAKTFHAHGLEVSIALEDDLDDRAIRALGTAADYALVMAYDETGADSPTPGPIASVGYIETTLKRFATLLPPNKLIDGIAVYGRDWDVPDKQSLNLASDEAFGYAARFRPNEAPKTVIDFDAAAMEPTFQYIDPQNNHLHEVWFQDAVTARNSLMLARDYGFRGGAIWSLGQEDASVWQVFGRHVSIKGDLHTVAKSDAVRFIGDGELLRVIRHPEAGARLYDVDPANGLITDETYQAYPSGWLVESSGSPDHEIALTFDDGPDPIWTPRILAVLRRHNIKATFFMIGEQVAEYPDIVREVYRDGEEIGNHSFTHPNMAHVSDERVKLELSATQRAFQAVLGRSPKLFRPPYNADSQPQTYGEIMPVAVADATGYVTAGESIDTDDWDLYPRGPDGTTHRLTAQNIQDSVMHQLDTTGGWAILMHDGGGDRSTTLASLDGLITTLQAQGYRFVTVGELEGHDRDWSMPLLGRSDRGFARIDAMAFTLSRAFNTFVFWGFTTAIALGLLRIALMIGLAAQPGPERPNLLGVPRVDAMIAAYNEAPVIVRTINSLLSNQGVDVRVIVVDDGSIDGTGDIVAQAFGAHPRVRLLRKPNGGKASALNLALTLVEAEIVVGVDADTQLAPNALALLARWFVDPAVGAVAGNVKVGNRKSLVTRWQSLEYITSQNVDRRAMSRLNAITVVPGAIGAYRTDALRQVGGYRSDTLAEDMDLTWRLREAGWVGVNEPYAFAFTEAPETLGGLMRQRFRWTFGTLQCLWKHRSATFHLGWFGWLALPTLWLFQIAAQVIAPLVDLQLVLAIVSQILTLIAATQHELMPTSDSQMWVVVTIYLAFLALEIAAGWLAYAFDREDKRELWLLPTQRICYRQIMYIVVWRSLLRALGGAGQAWGKLKRTGAVHIKDPVLP
jgi:cellulose synthase/poly-beta-1,6-N-acetylglucosamine synthase-like glycosyltransferase/peptidoglycan/xylan/chitin deacetylase (PgdA/CDA1 family)/spore germination protein YaaH